MPLYAITGATGQLGRLVLAALLRRGVAAQDIVAVARDAAKSADLSEAGFDVRIADYTAPETLSAAFAGVETLLFISGSEAGQRIPQHSAVVAAARSAGVGRIVYTSLLRADTSEMALAPEHKATEEMIAASGLTYTFLRNSWYVENYTGQLPTYLEQGVILHATGSARIAAATRTDYAEAAAEVLTGQGHDNEVYELGGTPFTMAELASTITQITGTTVAARSVSPTELADVLRNAGLDAGTAQFLAALDEATAAGALDTDSSDLSRLIGRPTTPLADEVQSSLAAGSVA